MVRRLSDPDGMGATPTHQADVSSIDTNIWGPKMAMREKSHYWSLFRRSNTSQEAIKKVISMWREEQFARAVAKRSAMLRFWTRFFPSTSFHHIPLRATPMTHTAYGLLTDP